MKAAVEKWSENMCRACGIGKGQRESNALARGFPAAMYAMWVRLRTLCFRERTTLGGAHEQ